MAAWNLYYELLSPVQEAGKIEMQSIPEKCEHNAHMFYIKTRDLDTRTRLISYLKEDGILAVFHYIPLHSAPAGKRFGRFNGEDVFTTTESDRLLRLPLYYGIEAEAVQAVCNRIKAFYQM